MFSPEEWKLIHHNVHNSQREKKQRENRERERERERERGGHPMTQHHDNKGTYKHAHRYIIQDMVCLQHLHLEKCLKCFNRGSKGVNTQGVYTYWRSNLSKQVAILSTLRGSQGPSFCLQLRPPLVSMFYLNSSTCVWGEAYCTGIHTYMYMYMYMYVHVCVRGAGAKALKER